MSMQRLLFVSATTLALLAIPSGTVRAQGKLEASYVASLAGIPLGKAVWLIDIGEDQFTAAANGRTTGLLQTFSGGRGIVTVQGSLTGGRPAPARYTANIITDKKFDEVKMVMSGGNVKEFTAEPVSPPNPDRVPLSNSDRLGVLDPMSASMVSVTGTGDVMSREACNRTLPIFDGRGRFDLVLTYKRMEQVKAAKGYQGPALVCAVTYRPVSGHRTNNSAVKYLTQAQDIELWLAPINGTRILIPFRASVPTVLGAAVVEATQFVSLAQTTRPTPTQLKTQ